MSILLIAFFEGIGCFLLLVWTRFVHQHPNMGLENSPSHPCSVRRVLETLLKSQCLLLKGRVLVL